MPHLWSDQQLQLIGRDLKYDLAPEGKRFAIAPELKASREEKGDSCDLPAGLLRRIAAARDGRGQVVFHGSGLKSRVTV